MKIISWNVNGIRAAHKKGDLGDFLENHSPDIFCIQETKAKQEQLEFLEEEFPQYEKFYFSAEKAGYSGTGIWAKTEIKKEKIFLTGMPNFSDTEGRISRIDMENISILGVYFPNGGKSPEAWNGPEGKLVFYEKFLEYVNTLKKEGRTVIFCGDVNTCHQAIDIARPKENDGKIGFHPLEREKISTWVEHGWQDVWRYKNPDTKDQYSWWSYRGGARERNVGWRIDYFFMHEENAHEVKDIFYLTEQKGSDHCPVVLKI